MHHMARPATATIGAPTASSVARSLEEFHFETGAEGRFYKLRGPLNTAPGPQRRPVICQAGGSRLCRQTADTIISKSRTISAAKRYRDDIQGAWP
jgi:alkanesulfonate monooxygenase SsuD/methylene tetrahydromethanopterin reductase-like flavin-dependent oxidoreductase (luciferase family)